MRAVMAVFVVFSMPFALPSEGASQSTLDGSWVMTIYSPLGPFEFPIIITQEGEELSATTPPSPNGEFTFSGSVDESSVRFEFETDYEGAPLLITLTGNVLAGEMAGPADFGGLAVGNWSAVKSEDEE